MFIILCPVFIGIALNDDAYGLKALQQPRHGIIRMARSLIFACVVLMGILFYMKTSSLFSRQVFGVGTVVAMILASAGRWAFGVWVGRRYRWRFTKDILLVDGASVQPQKGEIVLNAEQLQLHPSHSDPVLLDRIGNLLKNSDRVILATARDRRRDWVSILKGIGVDVEVLAPELDEIGALGLRAYHNQKTVLIGSGPLAVRDKVVKRSLDLVVVAYVLLLFAPIGLIIALLIKLDTPGPVFFSQDRIGAGNRLFKILKFRTMRVEHGDREGHKSTARDDDRMTRVGKFLRKTSLDELSQLINVLRNEMSIVGPRPHALGSTAENQLFWNIDSRYWHRHSIKPGITGLAQVRGYRGATSSQSDVTDRVQADLEYLVGWNVSRDVMIMLMTLKVLIHRNAF